MNNFINKLKSLFRQKTQREPEEAAEQLLSENSDIPHSNENAMPFDENNEVENAWNFLLSEDDWAGLKDFIELASKDELLNKLFPFTSLYTLRFSKCTRFPFDTTDMPHVTSIEHVFLESLKNTAIYTKVKQGISISGSKVYVVAKKNMEYVGEGSASEALRIVLDNLPENIGPARKGTADD